MTTDALSPRTIAWPAIMAMATVLGSLALACVFPFAAFAALAALTLPRRGALSLVVAVWAANQAVGFLLLSFPWDLQAAGHGIAILGTTIVALEAARFANTRTNAPPLARAATALVAAFVVYQVMLRAYAQFGGGAENFSAEIIAQVAMNDVLWFAGLMAVRFGLTRLQGVDPLPARA